MSKEDIEYLATRPFLLVSQFLPLETNYQPQYLELATNTHPVALQGIDQSITRARGSKCSLLSTVYGYFEQTWTQRNKTPSLIPLSHLYSRFMYRQTMYTNE